MEDQWKTEEDVIRWVRERLDRREKIMGMGHAVYKTHDPRAEIMKNISHPLARKTGFEKRYHLLETIERSCEKEFVQRGKKGIKANVDFYSGLVFSMMGVPVDIMTPVFAFSLLAGWCAHIIEEKFAEAQSKPALYRPEAEYVGNYCGKMGCTFVPMSER
jgi:citrate synthase